jgi:hypothetical protein
MQHCPACNASYRGDSRCHRCRLDLAPLLRIEEEAANYYRAAVAACHDGAPGRMFFNARRAHALHCTPASTRLLACAALAVRDFSMALSMAQRAR